MKRILRDILIISILIYLGYGINLYLKQDSIIYYPQYSNYKLEECAKNIGGTVVEDGAVRGVLFQKSTSSIIVIYHSNATSACERQSYAIALHNNPSSVFFVSYPGYLGDKTKVNNIKVLNQVADVVTWIKNNNYKVEGIVGESIGVGPASFQSYIDPAPLVLIAPFKNLSSIASQTYFMYPTSLLIKNDFDVLNWAKTSPRILLIIGTSDTLIKNKVSKDFYEALPEGQKKELILLDGFDHIDLLSKSEVPKYVNNFFAK